MQLRDATPDDHAIYLRLFPRLAVDDPPLDRARFVSDLLPSVWIAVGDAGDTLAYVYAQLLEDTCYVRHLVVDAAHEGRGVGRAVMEAVRARAKARGLATWRLSVKPENVRAIALYTACGMRETSRAHALRLVGWPRVAPLVDDVGARARVVVRDARAEEDAELERAYGLAKGQLAAARAMDDRALVVAHEGDARVAFAVFSAGFPGAYPFRARDLAATDALVAALAARVDAAPEGRAYFQLVVEDDEALARALLARGAVHVLEVIVMKGAL